MKKYKNRQVIGEFRKTFSDLIGRSTIADQAQLEQFLDEQLEKKEEEVLRKFVSFCKHWIRGHKKDDWHPILMDSFEAFLENRKEEFTNWEFEETVRTVELKTQK